MITSCKHGERRRLVSRSLVAIIVAVPTIALAVAAQVTAADGPVIDVWCGDDQRFGHLGVPQVAVNVLGNVSDPDGVAWIAYSLNGGPEVELRRGADSRRLAAPGDFNLELPVARLNDGPNHVRLRSMDRAGNESVRDVTVRFDAGNVWPNPYTIDWGAAGAVNDVAQAVDGKWAIEDGGLRIVETGYDRLVAIGDMSWTDYEITVPVTINAIDQGGFGSWQAGNGAGVGVLMRWAGHTDDPIVTSEPKGGWRPHGAIGWWWWNAVDSARIELARNDGSSMGATTWGPPPAVGSTLWYKMRVETQSDGTTLHALKIWDATDREPNDWTFRATEVSGRRDGSLLLLAHYVDATFGNVTVTPLGAAATGGPATGGSGSGSSTSPTSTGAMCQTGSGPVPDPGPDPDPPPSGTDGVFSGIVPERLVDTRRGQGGRIQSHNGVIELEVGSDPVALNVVAVEPTGPGHFVVYPCAYGDGNTSALNWSAVDLAVSNMVLATPDADGMVCVASALPAGGRVHVVVDRTGYLHTDGGFLSGTPERLRDTRREGRKLGAGDTMRVSGFAPSSGVILNLTVALPDAAGHLTAFPCAAGRPTASVSNYSVGQTKANEIVVRADRNGEVCIYTHASTDLVVDIFGTILTSDAEFITPTRLLDSRRQGGKQMTYEVAIPDVGVRAAILNVTAALSTSQGHATVHPCGGSVPRASTVNFASGQTVANHVLIAPNRNGRVCITTVGNPHIIVDLAGYLDQRD